MRAFRFESMAGGESGLLDPASLAATAAALVVVKGDHVYGEVAGGSEARSASPRTLFQVASAGKHVTACLIQDLASEGQIDLAEDVRTYLPELPASWGRVPVNTLLHHTSGLPDYLMSARPPPTNGAEFLAACEALKPMAAAGSFWSYSNTNYILLGAVAARVAGRPAGAQLQEILNLNGAGAARVASPDWVRRRNRDGERSDDYDQPGLARDLVGDGDIAFDLESGAAWLQRLLHPPAGWRHLDTIAPTRAGPALYGAGFFVEPFESGPLIHHAGHFDGWTAALVISRTAGAAVLAMCNGAPGHTRFVRHLALSALESAAPGTTPLGRAPLDDPDPDLSAMIAGQLLRGDRPLAPDCFAEAMGPLIAQADTGRGVINFGRPDEVRSCVLVERAALKGDLILRYRLDYGDRLTHLCVGVTPESKIFWVWPI